MVAHALGCWPRVLGGEERREERERERERALVTLTGTRTPSSNTSTSILCTEGSSRDDDVTRCISNSRYVRGGGVNLLSGLIFFTRNFTNWLRESVPVSFKEK